MHLRLRALRRALAEDDPRFTLNTIAAVIGIDASTIAAYESSDGGTRERGFRPDDYPSRLARYVEQSLGIECSEVDIVEMATDAYEEELIDAGRTGRR